MTDYVVTDTLVHLRVAGRSETVNASLLDVGTGSTDAAILRAAANHLDVAVNPSEYVVVREAGAIIVRPVAIYG